MLTAGGGRAAVITGAAAAVAGWGWAALLVGYFVGMSALSQLGRAYKASRAASVLDAGSARNGAQVAANGSVFAVGAVATYVGGTPIEPWAAIAALGALAAASADTAATEIGLLWGGAPRSIRGWRLVEPGTSGGVTGAGLGAAVGVATLVGTLAIPLGRGLGVDATSVFLAVALGGVSGCLADTLLGATIQARRTCERCGAETERRTHSCGGATRHTRGIPWLTNDVVNFAGTLCGAAVALAVACAVS